MHQRPSDPLDADRLPRLTVFGVPWCEDTAITRARLQALNVPFVYVDPEEDPAADAYVRGLHGGNRITPTVVVGVEEEVAAEPDLATVDRLARLTWPGLPIERPSLSMPMSADSDLGGDDDIGAAQSPDANTDRAWSITPGGLVSVSADGEATPAGSGPGVPSHWATGPAGHLAIVLLAHGGGCLPCLGYAKRLLAHREGFAGAGATAAVVVADDPGPAAEWRRDLPADARVLADPASRWRRTTLDRLTSAPGTPGSLVRFAADGVALLLIDESGSVLRMCAGPEAGHLPDPVTVADAIGLHDARASLRLDG